MEGSSMKPRRTTISSLDNDSAASDMLVVVDVRDREVGSATKERVHTEGLLHRAFSVVLLREGEAGCEILLARRAEGKYHSAGLWANSCCSHPRAGEDTVGAAYRRVREELGCEATGLEDVGHFAYRADFDDGLVEFEVDHIIFGFCCGEPNPNPEEVSETRWVTPDALSNMIAEEPQHFSAWAPMVLSIALEKLEQAGCLQ